MGTATGDDAKLLRHANRFEGDVVPGVEWLTADTIS